MGISDNGHRPVPIARQAARHYVPGSATSAVKETRVGPPPQPLTINDIGVIIAEAAGTTLVLGAS